MTVDVLRSFEELQRLEPEWRDLLRRAPDATPFQTPEWLMPWWNHFGGQEMFAVAVRNDDRLDALAPLYVLRDDESGESLGMLLGTGNSDYLDAVVASGADSLIGVLPEADCQLWDLQQLRPSSPLLTSGLPDGWGDAVLEHDCCPLLSIEGAGDELENLISTHFRKKIRYYRRLLERDTEVSWISANESNLDKLMAALYELHGAQWQQRGLPGVLADDVVRSFHNDAARRLLASGMLRLYGVRRGGRFAGVFYGFALHDTVYYYLSGYDPELERFSIGTLLVAHAIEQAVREGAKTFDFLRGAEQYKYTWGAKDRMNARRQIFRG